MQYFQAVQIGKKRANEAQMILFDAAGFAMLTLTTKKVDGKFVPVGENTFVSAIRNQEGLVIILVDEEGYTKTQSKPLELSGAKKIFEKVKDSGVEEFSGKEIEIWNNKFNTVHDELR